MELRWQANGGRLQRRGPETFPVGPPMLPHRPVFLPLLLGVLCQLGPDGEAMTSSAPHNVVCTHMHKYRRDTTAVALESEGCLRRGEVF